MIVDARELPTGTVVEADLCIIGAGAAGITLARELANSRFRVALVESGGMEFESETQSLYEGEDIGRPYLDLTTCRLRFFGGTTNHWGGWCLPLDPPDFEARDGLPYRGWPFDKAHLDPFYRRAHQVCQLGPYDYTPTSFGITSDKTAAPFTGPDFISRIFQISRIMFNVYRPELEKTANVTVYLHANAVNLATGEEGRSVRTLQIATLAGARLEMRARFYVLGAGGIENARLLLVSADGKGIGNTHDLVGRFFMVHLQFVGGEIALRDPYVNLDFASGFDNAKPWPFFSYIGLSDDAMRRRQLPNVRMMGDYKFAPVSQAVEALKRLTGGGAGKSPLMPDVLRVLRNVEGLTELAVHKALYHSGVPVETLILNCNAEQMPNPESRITLADERDALGMRRVAVDWKLTGEDKAKVNEIYRLLGAEVGRTGFGRLRYLLAEDNDTWPDDLRGNEHHMGTTRMHDDPASGVVDRNCRVHGVDNLYLAGSSVFPTSGATNPTLTIVALALRLADHLKERLA
jgi:choline dehydrogenase-like flavoprotein